MKILIAYYSRTGGTEKLAKALKEEFESGGHSVDMEKIRPVKEHSFFYWWHLRMIKAESGIKPLKIGNVSEYDVILVGSPNWTRLSLPVARYLKKVTGLKNKNVSLFSATAAPPALGWYIISAYLLNLTFSRIVWQKKGRVLNNLLLSSRLKRWSLESKYGKNKIKEFCQNIINPSLSFKDYFLKQKEIEILRSSVVFLTSILFFTLVLHIILNLLGIGFLDFEEYFLFLFIFLFTIFLLTTIREKEKIVFLGKYIWVLSIVLLWSLTLFYLEPTVGLERLMVSGYILIFIILTFFHNKNVIIFSGLISFFAYGLLFYFLPTKEVFNPVLDFVLISGGFLLSGWVSNSLGKCRSYLLETQDEIGETQAILEIKVKARTRELRELAERLDEEVKERTKEIQAKMEELEKFNKIAVGRELKMIELKKEIKKLKEKLKKVEDRQNKSG